MSTRPKPAEALIDELRASAERFRTIFENAPVMIDQFDADGRCLLWNRECERQLGYTQAEVAAAPDPLALFYPDDEMRSRVLDAITRADGEFREYRVRAKDQSERLQLWADFRLPDGSLISVGHDVTAQRRTEAQLRQSQKLEALGQLTGGVAHDFNNLLTVVSAHAEWLQRHASLDDQGRWSLREILLATERGASMIKKLLAFSRNEVLQVGVVDASEVVNDMAATVTRLLPDSIRVQVRTEPSLAPMAADRGAVEQALLNLVTNARDAMPEGGLLRISVESERVDEEGAAALGCIPGDYIAIAVSDDGQGMDEATKRHIFEPFFTTKRSGGSGLGMAMVYGLMQQQSGVVQVESDLGRGTTVRLLYPMAAPATQSLPELTGGSGTILLVEDLVALRQVARVVLEEEGFAVIEAADGARALELLDEVPVDLVLCDLIMPKLGGVELYQRLRDRAAPPPFLFVTGFASDETLDALANDDIEILRKPYTVDALLSAVRAAIRPPDRG
ncbi:MAG: response regulator [Polyangiaceae bacterium]